MCLTLLGALIHERGLVIAQYPPDFQQRLALIAGFQALLPGRLAARVTFASHAPSRSQHRPQLSFADEADGASAWIYDWSKPQRHRRCDGPSLYRCVARHVARRCR